VRLDTSTQNLIVNLEGLAASAFLVPHWEHVASFRLAVDVLPSHVRLFRGEGCEFVKGARSVPVGAGARPRVHCTKHATPLPGQPKEGLQGG